MPERASISVGRPISCPRAGEWFVTVGNGRQLDQRVQSGGVRMEGSIVDRFPRFVSI